MPRIPEINGGNDNCGKTLETRFKTLFSFFQFYAKIDQKFCNWEKKYGGSGRLVYYSLHCGKVKHWQMISWEFKLQALSISARILISV